jgi:hypothetical protein
MVKSVKRQVMIMLRSVQTNKRADLNVVCDQLAALMEVHYGVAKADRSECIMHFTPKLGANKKGAFAGTEKMAAKGDDFSRRRAKEARQKKGEKS